MRGRLLITILAFLPLVSGCASVETHISGHARLLYYPGVVNDANLIGDSFASHNSSWHSIADRCFGIIDFPFSLVLDTALLPVDAVRHIILWSKGDLE